MSLTVDSCRVGALLLMHHFTSVQYFKELTSLNPYLLTLNLPSKKHVVFFTLN